MKQALLMVVLLAAMACEAPRPACDAPPCPTAELACDDDTPLQLTLGDGEGGFAALAADALPAVHVGGGGGQSISTVHRSVGVRIANATPGGDRIWLYITLWSHANCDASEAQAQGLSLGCPPIGRTSCLVETAKPIATAPYALDPRPFVQADGSVVFTDLVVRYEGCGRPVDRIEVAARDRCDRQGFLAVSGGGRGP